MKGMLIQVDAFTEVPFQGNPAAVCLLHDQEGEPWMQAVAAEMNLSETAFLWQYSDGFAIRYFTPVTEVPLCGHATLASAHVFWEQSLVSDYEEIKFYSKSGILSAQRQEDWIRLDFPAHSVEKVEAPQGLAEDLGAMPISVWSVELGGYLAELDTEASVRNLKPDLTVLSQDKFGPVIVTAPSASEPYDIVSRFFWPEGGIDEDPVTGVAHCSLGPYWAERLEKNDLIGHQLSQRGGIVRVRVRGERVDILGQAVTVMRGEILV